MTISSSFRNSNTAGVITPSDFWDRDYKTLDEIWIELHRLQTDFCFESEIGFFYRNPRWHVAKNVIDLGSGSGYYLNRLNSVFSEKHFTGIDINNFFINFANTNNQSPNMQFECLDLFSFEGKFDFLLSRLVFQHLSTPEIAIDKIANFLNPGGCAFIIDALDQYRFFYPEPNEYIHFFKAFAKHQLSVGFDRDIAGRLPKLIEEHPKLKLENTQKLLIPSTISANLSLFEQTYYLVIKMLEKEGTMKYDFNNVKMAWKNWCSLSQKYMQVGLRYICLSRIA